MATPDTNVRYIKGIGETRAKALEKLEELRGCDAHFTVILARVDEKTYKALGIYATSEAQFERKR